MRISGGDLKGRKIGSKKSLGLSSKHGSLRPTSSKVRESVFNIIGGALTDSIFADLYAGTGAVGMEAMSRGAKKVYFVEADRKRAERIEEMLKDCGCGAKAIILKEGAIDFVNKAYKEDLKFDIVFLDPPYHTGELEDMISLLSEKAILNSNGIVIAEHSSKIRLPDEIGMLKQKKAYKYGDTMLTLFRLKMVNTVEEK